MREESPSVDEAGIGLTICTVEKGEQQRELGATYERYVAEWTKEGPVGLSRDEWMLETVKCGLLPRIRRRVSQC